MRKIFIMLFSLALIICFCSAAHSQVRIDLTNVAGAPGSSISVPIYLRSNGAEVGSLALDIGFNPNMLLAPEATINPAIGEGSAFDRILISNTPSSGLFRVAVIVNYTHNSETTQPLPDGLVATISFSLSRRAPLGSRLSLTNTPSSCTLDAAPLSTGGRGATVGIKVVAKEVCDGRDNDGNGLIDEDLTRDCTTECGSGTETCHRGEWIGCTAPQPQTYYRDADSDGYGNAEEIIQDCYATAGYVSDHSDCDDTDANTHPGAVEIPCNEKDDDCQGGDDTTNCSSMCVEDDSGVVDIEGVSGKIGEEIQVPLRLQSSSAEIYSLGLEIVYDTSILEYTGSAEKGDLTTSFTIFEVNDLGAGRLRVGGLSTAAPIPAGASGNLALLKFKVIAGQENNCYPLHIENQTDVLANFPISGGCVCIRPSCNGDLNGDGTITPMDALIAFRCYLGSGDCPDCTDVNGDGTVTPFDALCLFKHYLGQPSCLD